MTTFEAIVCTIAIILTLGFLGYMITGIIKDAVTYAQAKEEDKKEKLRDLRFTCIITCVNLIFIIDNMVLFYHSLLNK